MSEYGFGFAFAHRLNTGIPLSIVAGYGNGGGNEHTGYVGLGGEFEAIGSKNDTAKTCNYRIIHLIRHIIWSGGQVDAV